MKKLFLIGLCLCLMLACAACQGAEQKPAETPSDRSAAESVSQKAAGASSEQSVTRPSATATEIPNVPSTDAAPASTSAAQHAVQAAALFSAKQAGAIDCIVYRANGSVASDKQAGKTYELKTQEEMAPVLKAVQQKIWTMTRDPWAIKTLPSAPYYTLLLQTNGEVQLELGLCGDLEQAGYIVVKENGKLTCYKVPVATYQQLVKAHTFS